jgi:hypothetical protein
LEQIASLGDGSISIGGLTGLDDVERLVLARRLLDEGAVETVDPPT